ncbi:MAG TPA: HdeA/HdeB family chaperone [Methyloceanibacter sp.]|nr:HdeA/HdeB family chaperone [Methyloceanibacter sp.]
MPKRLSVFVALLLGLSSPLSAQVTIDVAKISCHQFATYKIAEPDRIAIWLHGYFHGKRGDLIVDTQELAGNTDKVKEYCLKNPDVPLMQAIETLFGSAN